MRYKKKHLSNFVYPYFIDGRFSERYLLNHRESTYWSPHWNWPNTGLGLHKNCYKTQVIWDILQKTFNKPSFRCFINTKKVWLKNISFHAQNDKKLMSCKFKDKLGQVVTWFSSKTPFFKRLQHIFKKLLHSWFFSLNLTHIRAFKSGTTYFYTLRGFKTRDLGPTMYFEKVE